MAGRWSTTARRRSPPRSAGSQPETGLRDVTISADARAAHQDVVTAMDVVGRLGVTDVHIATIRQRAE